MTLQECIARYESAQSPRPVTVTPLGSATVTARRLVRQIRELGDVERATVLSNLLSELRTITVG